MQYRTGTITVSNESATVTGSGTAFLSNVSIGDDIVVRDSALTPNQIVSYIVGGVVSDTELTLTAPYGGPSATGIPYVAHRDYLANGNPKWANGDVEFAAIQNRYNAETLPVSDFGSAAFSDTGTDSGNVMEVGAFGLGGKTGYPADVDDPNAPTEFYIAPSNHLGIVGTHWGLHISHQAVGYATQMEWRSDKFVFRNADGGVWSDPYDVHHTGNIQTTTGQSTTFPMTQKAVTDELNTRVKWVSGNKIITVADSGADFTTVMGAIAEAMKWRSIDGSVIVEIKSGYLVTEQLFFVDNDYSHINIKAQNDATIIVDHSLMSATDFEGYGASGFIACARGKSPMFQAQFEFLTRPASTILGALAIFNGEIYFGNNSGVKNTGSHGAGAYESGSVTIGSNDDFSGAGGYGVYGRGGGSVIMGNGNDFSGAVSFGTRADNGGSVIMGSYNDFSGAGADGVRALRGGSVTMGDNNDFSGVSVGSFSFIVRDNGLIQAGIGTIFTSGRERSPAAGTITTNGLIMG